MNIEFRRHSKLEKDMHIPDPEDGEDYIIPACISSTAVDSHHSRMDLDTTLKNFAEEASAGVVTMDSHNNQCGLGNTRDGMLKEEQVWADLTVVPDTPLSALASYPNTDIFIKMIRRGKVRDVSVGASGGTWECNICERDMWRSGRCYHWPGIVYQIEQDDGTVKEMKCIAIIKDAHLSEVSFVYSGANPDAKIIENTDLVIHRAHSHAEDGYLDQKQLMYLNKRFAAGLDIRRANDYKTGNYPKPSRQIGTNPSGGSHTMDLEQAKARIQELETENNTLKSDKTQLTTEKDQLTTEKTQLTKDKAELAAENLQLKSDLKTKGIEIDQERTILVQQSRKHYMEQRKENMTAEDLAAYEQKLEKLNLRELKEEAENMKIISEATADDKAETRVTPGQKTQSDDSTQEGGSDSPTVQEGPAWLQDVKEQRQRANSK